MATSLYLSQRFGERTSLLLGKINALDLLENDLFFGGWGNHRFMNAVFAAPPSGLVPPVFFGAIGSVRLDAVSVSLWVYDPIDRTAEYWPDDLFDEGVTFYFTPSYSTKLAGRPTTISLTGIYTTKSGVDFSELSENYQARAGAFDEGGVLQRRVPVLPPAARGPGQPPEGVGRASEGRRLRRQPQLRPELHHRGYRGHGAVPGAGAGQFRGGVFLLQPERRTGKSHQHRRGDSTGTSREPRCTTASP